MPITVSYDNLLQQAPDTADTYFKAAVRTIDKQFGDGYAKNNPELIAAYMRACSGDFNAAIMVKAIQEASEEIASALRDQG